MVAKFDGYSWSTKQKSGSMIPNILAYEPLNHKTINTATTLQNYLNQLAESLTKICSLMENRIRPTSHISIPMYQPPDRPTGVSRIPYNEHTEENKPTAAQMKVRKARAQRWAFPCKRSVRIEQMSPPSAPPTAMESEAILKCTAQSSWATSLSGEMVLDRMVATSPRIQMTVDIQM